MVPEDSKNTNHNVLVGVVHFGKVWSWSDVASIMAPEMPWAWGLTLICRGTRIPTAASFVPMFIGSYMNQIGNNTQPISKVSCAQVPVHWNDLVRRSFSKAKGWDVVTSVAIWERQPLQAYRILLAHTWAVESCFLQVLEKYSFELLLSHTEFLLVHTKGVNIGSDMQPAANFIQLLRSQRRPNTHDCNLQIVPVLRVLQQWEKFRWIPGASAGRLTGSLVPGKVLHGNRRNPPTKKGI